MEYNGNNSEEVSFKEYFEKRKVMGNELVEMAKDYFRIPFVITAFVSREKGPGSKGENKDSICRSYGLFIYLLKLTCCLLSVEVIVFSCLLFIDWAPQINGNAILTC